MERFLICGSLVTMSWGDAYRLRRGTRIKTSLALTRQRARRAMELWLVRSVAADLYMRGLIRYF